MQICHHFLWDNIYSISECMCVSSILYPLGSLSEHLLSWFVLTKAWFFKFWPGMNNNILGGKDLSHFVLSTPEISPVFVL